MLAHWHWYQKNYDEFRRFRLKSIFPVMGVRETRRVRGEYVLNQRDLIATLKLQGAKVALAREEGLREPRPFRRFTNA